MSTARGLPLLFMLAALVGVLGGFLGSAFRFAVLAISELVLGPTVAHQSLSVWVCLLVPAAGAALAGLCIHAVRGVRGPFGIADVMEIVTTRKGTIQPIRSLVHVLSSAFSISSGGSVGREAANSQFGATVGSLLGRIFDTPSRTRCVLLGCGIAAGMASAYKAPIAGAVFVMEVVLGNFAMDVFAPIVVSSVLSTLVTAAFFGWEPIYKFEQSVTDWYLVLPAALLGALCGFGGILFRKSLEVGRAAFAKLRSPLFVRMALGGLIVGAIGIERPEVWGNGQRTIEVITDAVAGLTLPVLALLTVLKIVATAVTTGSGALGGVFTPNMVVGAAFGAAFWRILAPLTPGVEAPHIGAAFAFVGMAGLCAASTHAPITAVVLVFELTGDYGLILPLMLCSIIGSVTARFLDPDSIYTARLRAKGHEVHHGIEEIAMHRTYVRDVMRKDATSVVHTASFDEILDLFQRTRLDQVYVTDNDGVLLGDIRLHDVKTFLNEPTPGTVVIAADLTRNAPFTHAEESLATIIPRFDDPELQELPVVRSPSELILIGRITRRDLVASLSEEVLGQRSLRAKLRAEDSDETFYVELPAGVRLERVRVPDALVDRSIDSLDPEETGGLTVVLLIERDSHGGERRVLPRPDAVLGEGMEMVVVGEADAIEAYRGKYERR